jgi:two-component system, NtrC family, response regulator AtoC
LTFIGRTPATRELVDRAHRIAESDIPVLIEGETGTGKEVLAREIHQVSRRSGPFVPVNCGAIPPELMEAEFFGHVRAAFTGADRERPGLFEAAAGGTLFLDEVGELPLQLQPKLLRALDRGEIRRVGSVQPREVDVRTIAATNRDLTGEVEEGRFRADLYARLDGFRIVIPPLRKRQADIPILARHFLVGQSISEAAIGRLLAYPWPHNVRELKMVMEVAAAVTDRHEITTSDLPEKLVASHRTRSMPKHQHDRPIRLDDVIRQHIDTVLESVDGNQSAAGRLLGISRGRLRRHLRRYSDQDGVRPD